MSPGASVILLGNDQKVKLRSEGLEQGLPLWYVALMQLADKQIFTAVLGE